MNEQTRKAFVWFNGEWHIQITVNGEVIAEDTFDASETRLAVCLYITAVYHVRPEYIEVSGGD